MPSQRDFPTFGDILEAHVRERPDAIAVRFAERAWSYAALAALAARVAATLQSSGIMAGDRIGLVGMNSDGFPILAAAAAQAGLIFVPIGWRLSAAEVCAIVRDAAIGLLFVEDPQLQSALALDGQNDVRLHALDDLLDENWLVDATLPLSGPNDPEATLMLFYTSGTTGAPKGVMLSHVSLFGIGVLRTVEAQPWDCWSDDDVTLLPLPLSHIGGFSMLARTLLVGGEALIQPVFDAGRVLDAIEHQRVSKMGLVPTALKLVIDHPRARSIDYRRIRTMLYGASPITLDLLRDAIDVFRCEFAQSYGMTETGATCVVLPPADHDPAGNLRMQSAGKALPGTELRIIDDDGATLPAGEIGEIAIRTISIMNGYWRMPEASAAALDKHGWYRTGDAGLIDADGYLFIKDRIKDMIVTGAENVYPAEVENALAEHPLVDDVAVFGVPDPLWGEAVKAAVLPCQGATIDPLELILWARGRIAPFKVPKTIDVVTSLPRNANGKIQKAELRRPYWSSRDRNVN